MSLALPEDPKRRLQGITRQDDPTSEKVLFVVLVIFKPAKDVEIEGLLFDFIERPVRLETRLSSWYSRVWDSVALITSRPSRFG